MEKIKPTTSKRQKITKNDNKNVKLDKKKSAQPE